MEKFIVSARLLTMLGDKLIEDGKVAIMELVKNSYDADANFAQVDFVNFGCKNELNQDRNSKIIIRDDGHGMSLSTIKNNFLNIATDNKHSENDEPKTSPNGRVYLGSHGIGRFSLIKLGRKIEILTKTENGKCYQILWDFTKYEQEFLKTKKSKITDVESQLLLDKIEFPINEDSTNFFGNEFLTKEIKGTVITIEELNESWSVDNVSNFMSSINIFTPINLTIDGDKSTGFDISIRRDNKPFLIFDEDKKDYLDVNDYEINHLKTLIENDSIYRIQDGFFDQYSKEVSFTLQKKITAEIKKVSFNLQNAAGFETFKDYKRQGFDLNKVGCGSFKFNTYIFNFDKSVFTSFNKLSRTQINLLKKFNIYLYRDGARVLPYGNEGIDWLSIDRLRAEARAGDYFSQGQLVGQIFITRKNNPAFQDKTSREGLINNGKEFDELTFIYRTILEFVKTKYFNVDKDKEEARIKAEDERKDLVKIEIDKAVESFMDQPKVVKTIKDIQEKYIVVKTNYDKRIDIVEQLAGAGMSVEVSSHELLANMMKLGSKLEKMQQELLVKNPDVETLRMINNHSQYLFKFALSQAENMKKLLVSTKQRVKKIRVNNELKTIFSTYSDRLESEKISFKFINENDLIVSETIDAVIYQAFSNLFDNAIYWLDTIESKEKKIAIKYNGINNSIIFSDNGPGIFEQDKPYIFDAFYTAKGVKGRGLGLYITKRLLIKYGYDIRLANKNESIYDGANFVIEFGNLEK